MIEEGNYLKSFWKNYTILENIYDNPTAWESVKQSTLVKSCRKILPSVENTLIESAEDEENASDCHLAHLAKYPLLEE